MERKGCSVTAARKLLCTAISINTTKFYLRSVFEVLRRSVPTHPARRCYFHAAVVAERSWIGVFLTGELTDLNCKIGNKSFIKA